MMTLPKYVLLEKSVGQTPLASTELWRNDKPEMKNIPLAYAGRLDPMASGQLLVLIGDECKVQEKYHDFDKQYEFSVLFGVTSDTADVLGRLQFVNIPPPISLTELQKTTQELLGTIELPYPHFSAKTVKGKPLHVWTLEGRLNEITLPTKISTIYKHKTIRLETKSRRDIYRAVSAKIELIPPITEASKILGNDFRRVDVRADWLRFSQLGQPTDMFSIATFVCIAGSGTYMRTLAEVIARACRTIGLAYCIHRTHIGLYQPLPLVGGFWRRRLT